MRSEGRVPGAQSRPGEEPGPAKAHGRSMDWTYELKDLRTTGSKEPTLPGMLAPCSEPLNL